MDGAVSVVYIISSPNRIAEPAILIEVGREVLDALVARSHEILVLSRQVRLPT